MLYLALYLWRALGVIGAIVGSLTVNTDQWSTALGAFLYEIYLLTEHETGIGINACYLGDDFTTLLYVDHVTDVKVEFLDYVGIMERSALYHCTRQLYGVKISHRSDNTSTAHLICNLVQAGKRLFGLELVCYCPAG